MYALSPEGKGLHEVYSYISHPNEVCMSYAAHWMFSMTLAVIFATASCKAIIHSFAPSLFQSSSTDATKLVSLMLSESGCNGKAGKPVATLQ